ncbi:hypothetical protein X975_00186, partial [Stegodyphus mimosarum]
MAKSSLTFNKFAYDPYESVNGVKKSDRRGKKSLQKKAFMSVASQERALCSVSLFP